MMVQAATDMGDTPRKEAEVSHDESKDKDHVPIPSSDPLPSGTRVKSPLDKECLGAHEDASKHRRMIEVIDQDDEIALDADTQERKNDDEMFGVDDLSREEVVLDNTTDQSHIPTVSSSRDKGKAKMIEPEVPIKKKDQMRMDKEYTRQLEAKEQEAARLSRAQQDEEGGYKHSHLKRSSYDEIKKLFDREMRKVNKFIAMDSEVQKSSGKESQESSTKRTVESLESEIYKKEKQSNIPTASSSNDKGKAKMIEPEVPIKKKDQMRMDK
nr:hypothetical protein [Tanacetum cinerariifolium]